MRGKVPKKLRFPCHHEVVIDNFLSLHIFETEDIA